MLAGVYGGSPDALSAVSVLPKFVEYEQRFGSVVVGALREKRRAPGQSLFKTLRHGLGSLIDVLRERTNIVRTRVESIRRAGEFSWQVFVDGAWQEFNAIVLSCGANHAAPLLAAIDGRAGELLNAIPYTDSMVWTLGYGAADIPRPLDAFGFLVPRLERRSIMACTWLGTKWQNRVPAGKAVLRCFTTDLSVTEAEIREDLQSLMGITAEPLFALQHSWPASMPQYAVGHSRRMTELEARVGAISGLYLAGNAYQGVGIPDCIRTAKQVVESITRGAQVTVGASER